MAVTPREEQEVILNYDRESECWYLYSDVPTFNRKVADKVSPEYVTVEPTGVVSLIDGPLLDGATVSVRKKRVMSEEQRQAAAERLQQVRDSKKLL